MSHTHAHTDISGQAGGSVSLEAAEAALKARAQSVCAEHGVRLTDLRWRTLLAVAQAPAPIKAYDLLPLLGSGHKPAKPTTAYRSLDFWVSAGLVHRIERLNAYVACDACRACDGAHGPAAFFICEQCGSTLEQHAHGKGISKGPDGFQVRRAVMEYYGVCANCTEAACDTD